MSYDLLFSQALQLHQAGRLDEAEQIYRQILETAPQNPDVINLLGLIAQSKGLHEEAAALFTQALKITPDFAPYYFNLGLSFLNLKQLHQAEDMFLQALQYKPDFKEALFELGHLAQLRHDFSRASQYFTQAVAIDTDYVEAKVELAQLSSDAIAELTKLCSAYSSFPQPFFALSRLYRQRNEYKPAVDYATQALTLSPDNPEILLLLGDLYHSQGQNDTAQSYYTQVMQLQPSNVDAIKNMADILTLNKQFSAAETLYKQALDYAPVRADILINYADMLYRDHRTQEAVEIYHKAVILSPSSPEISNNLGIITRDLGDYEEALGLFFNALHLAPQQTAISANIAETLSLFSVSAPDKAAQIAANWLKSYPDNSFAQHMSSALDHKADTQTQSSAYSRDLFNIFAPEYEAKLQKIAYNLPQQLKIILGELSGNIVDLGCGTGLVAEQFKSPHNNFIGVDISAEMLKLAAAKHLYSQLFEQDILHFLSTYPLPSMVQFIAADVFCYFGDLSPLLERTFPHPICFSVEKSQANTPFELTTTGRFKHNPDAINTLLRKIGYSTINQYSVTLRQEAGQNVEGVIFTAT